MRLLRSKFTQCAAALALLMPAMAQQANVQPEKQFAVSQETVDILLKQLAAHEVRIKQLEERLAQQSSQGAQDQQMSDAKSLTAQPAASSVAPSQSTSAASAATSPVPDTTASAEPNSQEMGGSHEHTMELPGGGPKLKIRGFFDFNFGVGRDANPLIFPLNAAVHNTFQSGEFDLFMTSKLSDSISFLSELVVGSDETNQWGLDIERLELTYRPSEYFQISAGRYHTSIGYYNTAFHHGTWFQTATGRPFMYFFEDSGGILPVHSVGVSVSGLVPGTDRLGLHWVAEAGNGRSSSPFGQPVQNFLSDKNHKDFNLAAYIAPARFPGLQVGGSYYRDRMVPTGIAPVEQRIVSAYVVYIAPKWEFMNEGVMLTNRVDGQSKLYNTPLWYTQISRKLGNYRPYFRYQYVNSPLKDPVNIYTGRYAGPSLGLRMDFTNYAALKLQYNRLYQLDMKAWNGLDTQIAFTF